MVHSDVQCAGAACEFTIPLKALKEASVAGEWMLTSIGALTTANEDAVCGSLYFGINNLANTPNTTRVWALIRGEVEVCEPTDPSVGLTSSDSRFLQSAQDDDCKEDSLTDDRQGSAAPLRVQEGFHLVRREPPVRSQPTAKGLAPPIR